MSEIKEKTYQDTILYKALEELDKNMDGLLENKIELNIVGGFAMILNGLKDDYYTDIDYVGEKVFPDSVSKLIDRIGLERGLGEGWINNDFMLAGNSREDLERATGKLHFYPLFELNNIKANVLDAKDLLRLKVIALDTELMAMDSKKEFTRAKDLPDIKALMDQRDMSMLDLEMEIFMISDIADETYNLIDEYCKTQDLEKIVKKVEGKGINPVSIR